MQYTHISNTRLTNWPVRLMPSLYNNNNNNIHICIAPYGRNFRGADYVVLISWYSKLLTANIVCSLGLDLETGVLY